MAAAVEMGEVDELHLSSEENVTNDVITNGDVEDEEKSEETQPDSAEIEETPMETDEIETEEGESNIDEMEEKQSNVDEGEELKEPVEIECGVDKDEEEEDEENDDVQEIEEIQEIDEEDEVQEVHEIVEEVEGSDKVEESEKGTINSADDDVSQEVQEVDDNTDDEMEVIEKDVDVHNAVGINDSNETDDIMIVDETIKENGTGTPEKTDDSLVIELDATPTKEGKPKRESGTPRRSSRNMNKSRSYNVESDKDSPSEESDVEEVLPQDPLAVADPLLAPKKSRNSSATIVVKDTKRLVEIAAKTSPNNSNKKEPTLVIIDTNSILSGRGPIPITQKPSLASQYPIMPVALPAQGIYPANMRATITPIPMASNPSPKASPNSHSANQQAPILPSLTDDMFVVEAPSFIVPYVYEKPPVKDLKDFVKTMAEEIRKRLADEKDDDEKSTDSKDKDDEQEDDKKDNKMDVDDDDKKEDSKRHTYFGSPIGKFFVDIGSNLVQEFVQTDLLKQQKRKRDREGGQNSATSQNIQSLLKSLEYTKENNLPYKMQMKKCEFCSYRTESALAMAFHLETPHMKNFVYRCNFCAYEVRSPHDILFHMEAEHCVRGRLERAPAFHQCPNCPFEDNQKGKLSRHSVACARKFKPERNLEPPIDWEPPAKIPRAPRMKQQSLTATAAMYNVMKTSQMQFMKMQQTMAQSALNRGRGRPSLSGVSSKQQSVGKSQGGYKQTTVPGGASVLVPTNYQISGNQLYQVVGGQDMGSRIGGPMGLIPTIPSNSSTVTIQNATNKTKAVHQPSISITPLPRGSVGSNAATAGVQAPPAGAGLKPGDSNSKNSFVICEICDGYIKDLEQLRNHMQWIHKVKIHPKMIYNRPPLNCQKCQFRFFTDQGLERHLLGSHGLVTSSMQDAANKCKDSGRCPVCGRVYQWKLLNHVARDHNMTLKPAHLSYKCTVCTATFGMYKQFENHVYSAHSVVAKRSMDKKVASNSSPVKSESLLKPLKINDEITIIPQLPKSNGAGSSKEGSPSTSSKSSSNSSTPGTSKTGDTSLTRGERLARRNTALLGDN